MSLKSLFTAATGMDVQQTQIDSIANNLANMNTTGYKASNSVFEDMIYDQVQTPGLKNATNTASPIGIQVGHGARLVGVYKHFSQGDFVQTNRDLDLAIEGSGFFQVTLDNGEAAYSRDGGLKLSPAGVLVNNRGYQIQPSVTIPTTATSVTIAKDGTVTAAIAGQPAPQQLGTVQLVTFQNPSGLKSIGQNVFQQTDASGTPTTATPGLAGAGTFQQGFLENSNVNVASELINMVVAQRAYEANSKVLTTTSEMLKASNNIV